MDDVIVEQKGAGAKLSIPPPILPFTSAPSVSGAVRTEPNEREWLRGPLSRDVSYRLVVSGELGPKEIGKLIKLLKAQQAVLTDEDGEESDE
jgi:hypothetical protein